jgi:RHS repeat-associated protein
MNLARSRRVSVTGPSCRASYTYAADGIRLRIQESKAQYPDRWKQSLGPEGAGMAAQRVQPYDGVRPVLEGTLSGDTYTTLNKYVWEGGSYYDPLMYSLIGGSWRYHMYDGLGSTRQLMLHTDQSITDTYQYEAFGNLLSSTGTTPNLARSRPPVDGRDRHGGAARPHLATYRYVGSLGYYQTGNSLMHLGARYCAPELGRFIQADPSGYEYDLNLYSYAYQTPTWLVDPDGLGIGDWIIWPWNWFRPRPPKPSPKPKPKPPGLVPGPKPRPPELRPRFPGDWANPTDPEDCGWSDKGHKLHTSMENCEQCCHTHYGGPPDLLDRCLKGCDECGPTPADQER